MLRQVLQIGNTCHGVWNSWNEVDKAFGKQQEKVKELGIVLDHLAVSAKKYETSVVDFFAKQEDNDKFSPLAKRM